MWLIAGLGNPGPEYAATRHNLGFEVVSRLAKRWRIGLDRDGFDGIFGKGSSPDGEPVVLLEPMTYMNRSGQSVAAAANFFKVDPPHLIVVLDDLALPPGRVRLRAEGSAGGHNGLADVIRRLGRDDFGRVRVGIGPTPPGWSGRDYVLARIGPQDAPALARGADLAADAVETWVSRGAEAAMNRFNARPAADE